MFRLAAKNKNILLLEGGATGTGQRDVGGIDYVASYFKTDPITGMFNCYFMSSYSCFFFIYVFLKIDSHNKLANVFKI